MWHRYKQHTPQPPSQHALHSAQHYTKHLSSTACKQQAAALGFCMLALCQGHEASCIHLEKEQQLSSADTVLADLSNPVRPVHTLIVSGGIPAGVDDDHPVSRCQCQPQASNLSSSQEPTCSAASSHLQPAKQQLKEG
jgi:hypothetical protein